MNTPPIPSDLKGKPKEKLDVVFASGPGNKVYAIPTNVAAPFEHAGDHAPLLASEAFKDSLNAPEEEEVGGRHAVLLADGSVGYHSDWLYGPYIWWVDGCSYVGLHWHPNRYSPLACDTDG